jgi:hypothetical protein
MSAAAIAAANATEDFGSTPDAGTRASPVPTGKAGVHTPASSLANRRASEALIMPVMVSVDWKPMTLKDDLQEYMDLAGPYATQLTPRMSIKYKSDKHSRQSVDAVLKYLTGKGKQAIISKFHPNGATADDVSKGFLYGTEAHTRALADSSKTWKNSRLLFTQEGGRFTPTHLFESGLFLSIMVYILQAIDLREEAEGGDGRSKLGTITEAECDTFDFASISIY